jgi:hypothetical protein
MRTSVRAFKLEPVAKGKNGGKMKLSVEAKVAAAVAAGFVALTVGTIAQGNSAGRTGEPDIYGSTNNPGMNPHISQHGYNSFRAGRTNAQQNRQKFASEDDIPAANKSGKKANSIKTRKHHTQGGRQTERI